MFMRIASSNDFVMHSLLGLSASHLSWETANGATMQLAYQHRGYAFQGLQVSIGNFSKENSDAVLAASILLSWQVTDWPSWASLLQGTSTVIDAMQSWKHESEFAEFMEEKEIFTRGAFRPQIADLQRDRHVVNHVYSRLLQLVDFFRGKEDELTDLRELINFVQGLHELIPANSADVQFAYLHPLRTWLFFLPIDLLKRGQQDPYAMLLLAQFYGVALAIEPLFPAVGAAYFGTMSVGPIEQIHRTLKRHESQSLGAQQALRFMEFPLEMVQRFRERMNWRRLPPAVPSASPTVVVPNNTVPKNIHSAPHHQQLGGWNFNAFPEYAMVRSTAAGDAGHHSQSTAAVSSVVGGEGAGNSAAIVEDVHGSIAASDFIACTMWRRSP